MASIGEAFIDVHANTQPFHREVARDLDRAADDAEGELNKTGQSMGDKVSDGIVTTLRRRGKSFAKAIGDGTRNQIIRVRSIFRFDQIRDSIRRRFRRDVGDTISEEIRDALDRSTRSGVFDKLTSAIADAVGAGFNVSGRSPLIVLLIPALLAIGALIVAALQAVNSLVAVLFTIPTILGSIVLQAGVLVIAFQGMGKAIQGAFAAKNAKELREALRGLTPSARGFVRELLPLRDFFNSLRKLVQEKFFSQFLGMFTVLRKALGPILLTGLERLAVTMGRLVFQLLSLFSSPAFATFLKNLFSITNEWLKGFSSTFFGKKGFLAGLIAMSNTLMPFIRDFGKLFLSIFERLAELMFMFSTDPGTMLWLERMEDTFGAVLELAFQLGEFLFVFFQELDRAGGFTVIQDLTLLIKELSIFLASPVGRKAMEGLVHLAQIGLASFTGLLIAILAVVAAIEYLGEWLRGTAGPFILDILRAIGQAAVDMATFLGVWIERIIRAIGGFFVWLWNKVTVTKGTFSSLVSGAVSMGSALLARFKAIPGQIVGALKNLPSLLINSGRALIQGLINGIQQKIQPLLNLLNWIASRVGGFFGNSPAIYGPLKGRGWTKFRGQNLMRGLIEGIQAETPALRQTIESVSSNIVFGPKSVQVNFQGTGPPTEPQARTIGAAVGVGAANMIAARNTRLAVRTM